MRPVATVYKFGATFVAYDLNQAEDMRPPIKEHNCGNFSAFLFKPMLNIRDE